MIPGRETRSASVASVLVWLPALALASATAGCGDGALDHPMLEQGRQTRRPAAFSMSEPLPDLELPAMGGDTVRYGMIGARTFDELDGPVDSLVVSTTLDSIVPGLLEQHDVPGLAVGVVEDGRVALTRGYGVADRASGRAMTDGTLVNVASLSKPVTAWGVLRLAETHALDLDAPVASWLQEWPLPPSRHPRDGVTLRRLLSHTAGLSMPSVPWFPADSARPGLQAVLRGETGGSGPLEIASEPGTRWSYSGGGYALLQLIVEEVSGQPFPDYMRTHLFEPLGMYASTFVVDTVSPGRLAVPHDGDGDPVEPYRLVGVAAGGLHSTARDFARLLAAYTNGSDTTPGQGVVRPGTVSRMLDPVAEVDLPGVETGGAMYGLGHNVYRTGDGQLLAYHSGGNPGVLGYFLVAARSGHGIVLLANSSRAVPVISGVLQWWAGRHSVELPPLY